MPTVVDRGGQLAGDGAAAGLLAQGDEARRPEDVDRARTEGDRRVRLGDDELGLASQSGRDTHDIPGYGSWHAVRCGGPSPARDAECDGTARLVRAHSI